MTATLVLGAVSVLAFVAWYVAGERASLWRDAYRAEVKRHRRTILRAQAAEAALTVWQERAQAAEAGLAEESRL